MARRLRIAAMAAILVWFFVPQLQRAIPLWLPFLTFAALELRFLVLGLRERGSSPISPDRSPQESDIADLGGEEWLEPVIVEVAGRDVWLPVERPEERPSVPIPESRRRPRARSGRLVLQGLVALGAFAVVLFVLLGDRGWQDLDRSDRARTEALLSTEAGRIAGHEVRIRCDAKGEAVGIVQHADGLAEVGGSNAFLTPDLCYRLYRLGFKNDEGAFSQTARAIAVLAHESWHLRGVADEGVVNCYAFQSGVGLGERLGLSESTAARMMRQQLVESATFARSAPEYLVPGECRNGGRLDLDSASSRFP